MVDCFFFVFFNDTATTEIYTLSLHDALPIYWDAPGRAAWGFCFIQRSKRSEEHTSELQSHHDLVCRLLLEKKKKNTNSLTRKQKKTKKKTQKSIKQQ